MGFAVLSVLLLAALASAEEEKGSLYIVKVNGDTVFGAGTVQPRIFAPDVVVINGDTVKVSDVQVLKNEFGYFRHPLAGFGDEQMALRTFDGKVIDKYTIEQTGFTPAPGGKVFGAAGGGMNMSTWKVGLYSKNDGDLKGIDYDNVKADFWDNEGSRAMIEIYERKRSMQWWFLAGGLVALVGSAPFAEDYAVAPVVGTAGLVAIITSIYHINTKKKYLYKAVERYAE